jgi:hypothetical protein
MLLLALSSFCRAFYSAEKMNDPKSAAVPTIVSTSSLVPFSPHKLLLLLLQMHLTEEQLIQMKNSIHLRF